MSTNLQHKSDTSAAKDRFAVVATVDGKTQLWATTTKDADPGRLVRAFPAADFGPQSTNHLRVMKWLDWKRVQQGMPALDAEGFDDEPTAPPVDHRAQVIAGLLELAQFLHDNPDVPVYRYAAGISFGTNENDGDGAGIARVRQMAEALGVEADHDGTHWGAKRMFGAVSYGCTYVERAHMAEYEAAQSYIGAVEPDASQP